MEFYGSIFQSFLQQNNIKIHSTQSELKSCVVERPNKTLKHKMEKFITIHKLAGKSIRWTKILPKIVKEYNNTKHSFHKLTPSDARVSNNEEQLKQVWIKIFLSSLPDKEEKANFKVDDYIRLQKCKATFTRDYKANCTEELFRVKRLLPTNPIAYIIEDHNLEETKGAVYENEMVHTAFRFV